MYEKLRERYLKSVEKKKAEELSALHRDLTTSPMPSSSNNRNSKVFSTPSSSAGLGFDLMWGSHEDEQTSSSEEEIRPDDDEGSTITFSRIFINYYVLHRNALCDRLLCLFSR